MITTLTSRNLVQSTLARFEAVANYSPRRVAAGACAGGGEQCKALRVAAVVKSGFRPVRVFAAASVPKHLKAAMLFLLSPAKSLDYETPPVTPMHTRPLFSRESAELIRVLKTKTPQQIASLMKLSDSLSGLNAARYQAWSNRFTVKNSKQAVLAFNGDVYGGLNAKTLSGTQLEWAQAHLCILSGLYGVLRPLDWMQPYRLEMGTGLVTDRGSNLYQFWGSKIAEYLNLRAASSTSPVIVNLASEEYFKVVDRVALRAPVVNCVFEEFKAGKYAIVSFYAKRARGLMVRYAIEKNATTVKMLQGFGAEGYRFDAAASAPGRLVFRRRQAA